MCTAVSLGKYAARNLDVYKSYNESVIITPRKFTLSMRKEEKISEHYAIIGMGVESLGYPLYFDAANERGLYMAGLNYVGNANYFPPKEDKLNVASFELIPYVLSQCSDANKARELLSRINVTNLSFSREMPAAELHWFIADKDSALIVEPDKNGLNIYETPIGVLTNNPSFPIQTARLSDYMHLSPSSRRNTLCPDIPLAPYSEGMGGIGLPGDLSSASRFVRAVFHKSHLRSKDSLSSIFHLLSSVEMPDGSVTVGEAYERTEYASAVNLSTLTYYYRAYDSVSASAVRLFSEDLDARSLIIFPTVRNAEPIYQN